MRTIIIENEQNTRDIALQEYGSIEGLFDLMKDNPEVIKSLNTKLVPGTRLKISSAKKNKEIADYFAKKNYKVTTGNKHLRGDFNKDFNNDYK